MQIQTLIPSTSTTASKATTPNAVGGAATAAKSGSTSQDFDKFLKLLTSQLQNQDPLSPMDATQFTTQLVQFSQVEQSINQNKKLDQLVSLQSSSQALTGSNYVGQKVDALSDKLPLVGGKATAFYAVSGTPDTMTVKIVDSKGAAVRTFEGDKTDARHTIEWDGKNDSGTTMPDGTYSLQVVAKDAAKKALDVQTGFSGTVSGVNSDSSGLTLAVGDVTVPLTKLVALKGAATTSTKS